MKNKRVLVTGGAGFIGSNLVKTLIQNNNIVTILDNLSSGHKSNIAISNQVNFIDGDIRCYDDVLKSVIGTDIIFHLAASVGNKRSIDFPIQDAETNVIGTLNLLEAARKNNIQKIVTSSSAGIFGELFQLPIKENHPIEPDTPYGCTKLCEEKLCLSYSKLYNLNSICLRYFNVYGPNQRFDAYGNVIPIFVYKALKNEKITIFGDGKQTRDFVFVDDVVQANIKAAESVDISGAFNIASGNAITINQLVDIISKILNKKLNIQYGPKRSGDVLNSTADITLAKNLLSYSPDKKIENGLKLYIEWASKTTDFIK